MTRRSRRGVVPLSGPANGRGYRLSDSAQRGNGLWVGRLPPIPPLCYGAYVATPLSTLSTTPLYKEGVTRDNGCRRPFGEGAWRCPLGPTEGTTEGPTAAAKPPFLLGCRAWTTAHPLHKKDPDTQRPRPRVEFKSTRGRAPPWAVRHGGGLHIQPPPRQPAVLGPSLAPSEERKRWADRLRLWRGRPATPSDSQQGSRATARV